MKLKKWLIISHLIIMFTPILIGLSLFKLILNYNKSTELNDYLTAFGKFKEYEEKLDDPNLYINSVIERLELIKPENRNSVVIELYNSKGQQIYNSEYDNLMYSRNKEELYSSLYKINIGYRAYTLKKPVFKDNRIIGFYKIVLARENFVQVVNNRTLIAVTAFLLILLTVFIVIVILLNLKFNRPIKFLVEGMNKFANGDNCDIQYNHKDEIGELIQQFSLMKKDIEEKRQIINQQQKNKEYMISAISHDLKTPLTSIRAYAEALESKAALDKDARNKIHVILTKSDFMKKMLDDLLMYNLLTTDYEMNFVEADGTELLDMLFSGYEDSCRKENIHLYTFIDVEGIYQVDITQITRVIDNLMSNAIVHTSKYSRIWMGAFSIGKKMPEWLNESFEKQISYWKNTGCIILIKNEGEGIPEDEWQQIFTPFYQRDESRNKTFKKGVGLGLSIVKLIIEKHNGEIKVFSDDNCSIFACWLPEKQS